ncbi:MAG TPA: hypothetical protein VGO52_26730 [Hyphomonadaceae bacterium]|nr:hypothetical protein [Hyphomonadaceae bacterium]
MSQMITPMLRRLAILMLKLKLKSKLNRGLRFDKRRSLSMTANPGARGNVPNVDRR